MYGLRSAIRGHVQGTKRSPWVSKSRRYFSASVRASQQIGPFGSSPGLDQDQNDEDSEKKSPKSKRSESSSSKLNSSLFKMFESAATTFASILVLGLAGYSYHKYYKHLVLKKMENAFKPGDPVLEMAAGTHSPGGFGSTKIETDESTSDHEGSSGTNEHWIPRPEQQRIDAILSGAHTGHYHLLIGEKGTGKSSMLIEAMRKVDGEGISMFEAHADLEIFRIRLGKALDFEFHEDYIGSFFSIRGPRDTTALLDIERAFNKLEKIALRRKRTQQRSGFVKPRPLVLVVNCAHLIRDDEDGRDLLEMMQQRAEAWSASNLLTMVFNSDDYWVYERLKRYATRMEVLPVLDLPRDRAVAALSQYRKKYHPTRLVSDEILDQVYDRVGGRLTFLNRVAKARDMLGTCDEIKRAEKTWFLNRCWILGEEMDDDVMDQQKYSSAAMVLAKALVDQEKSSIAEAQTSSTTTIASSNDQNFDTQSSHILPSLPLHKARQTMTRADFIQSYDHDNIFTITADALVRADSVPMMNAFREICSEPGFDEYLNKTLDRIAAIESLGRTREVSFKDLWREQTGEQRGKIVFMQRDGKGKVGGSLEMRVVPDEVDEGGT